MARVAMVEQFLGLTVSLLPALQEIEQRLDREIGRRFNAFDFFIADDSREIKTTRCLQFLLDRLESHGQGSVFLEALIRQFIPEWQNKFIYNTSCKAYVDEAIDLTISDGVHWLGIENKAFGAPEQQRQAGRYLDALRAKAKPSDEYRLIYLRTRGEKPSKYSLPLPDGKAREGKLVCAATRAPRLRGRLGVAL